ncbi:glycosyltransferase family 2 protein [Polynucleobacter sp. MWH-UH24A]|uniref:glycosyltransferase family 2 protein n=1 Tax=Polynucleobacter sp. MWH-UH24A TaxID=2689110 RepID=UPI001BFD31C4|nr:glycosyltransferase family 2 protein [Polynucleobacter sp. MWH-UH24A]QWD76373.1 glycosyltransferase family 2 protein [Polynucleobacter sp. MWH-UH24A]
MKLSLIIPCYNEGTNLPLLLDRCQILGERGDIEIILVDNGSTDDSATVLEKLMSQYRWCKSIRVPINLGYGYGILMGLREARGELLGWTHADLQTDPKDLLKALPLFERYGNLIYVKGQRKHRPFTDNFFTVGMSIFEILLLRRFFWDINAQPNLFPRSFYEKWVQPPHDFSLDLYVYFKAKESNLTIHRIPVEFGKRIHGNSHWNINWQGKWKFIKRTIQFSFKLRRSLNQ